MPSGTVKWFNRVKGYGFIRADSGEEIFVHRTGLSLEGRSQTLRENDRVSFDVETGDRGPKAVNVSRLVTDGTP
jgi:CspA family cold shock protein